MGRIQYQGIADAQLPSAVPADRYDLRLLNGSVETGQESHREYIAALVEIPSQPRAKNFTHRLFFPKGIDRKKDETATALTIKFLKMFDIPFEQDSDGVINFDTDDFAGKTAQNVLLRLEPDLHDVMQNAIDIFNT